MQIKRQNINESIASPPKDVNPILYGEIVSDIEGRLYCRNKQGRFNSLATSASIASSAQNVIGLPSVGTAVPANAAFSDHTYSLSTGIQDGTIKLDYQILGPISTGQPSGSYEVAVKGLGTAAFRNENYFVTANSSSSFITEPSLNTILSNINNTKTINATSIEGYSLSDILNVIDEKIEQALNGGIG